MLGGVAPAKGQLAKGALHGGRQGDGSMLHLAALPPQSLFAHFALLAFCSAHLAAA
jgi:hypothetical protein